MTILPIRNTSHQRPSSHPSTRIGFGFGRTRLTKHEPHNPAHQVENTRYQIAREAEDGLDCREEGVEYAGEDFEEGGEEVGDAGCEGGHGGGCLLACLLGLAGGDGVGV